MKCDELKAYGMDDPAIGDEYEMYKVTEVDEAIAELKRKLETVNELVKTSNDLFDRAIESLKASHDTEMVDAGMRERRLRMALWLARAEKAKHIATFCYYALHYGRVPVREIYQCQDKWDEVERKCLKKAKEWR